ncbi:MAG: tRNA lysidine(34) synthetase TilS [Amaricoccus sp.]|uniref:tRNA lysidine(34) synthetase TilS n=1 Tax=Amaricoccus sp. TaxID=1872485 RepID=UPI0039E4171B
MIPPEAAAAISGLPPGRIAVAVSGGSDSTALLLLMHAAGREVAAVTVDHGLRAGSAAEAASVARLCAERGLAHATLRWAEPGGAGNLQARAREARRRLMADWARGEGIGDIALGHTLDDQAETVVLRLARGSGVDGLAAMAAVVEAEGVRWHRPLLGVRRAALRDWLAGEGVGWIDDPSNADPRFDRVRVRTALPALAALGLGPERLAATARGMARAREALEQATRALARGCLTDGGAGDLLLDPAGLTGAPEELRLRLIAGALGWVSGEAYRPRLARLEAALAAIEGARVGHGLTLHGCVLRARAGRIAIRREPARVAAAVTLAVGRWDGRWELVGEAPSGAGLTIGALGAGGLARLGGHPAGLAREALATTPAIWRAGELVAAPIVRPEADFGFRRIAASGSPLPDTIPR